MPCTSGVQQEDVEESQGTQGCACVKSVAKLATGGESAQSPGARRGQEELSGTGKVSDIRRKENWRKR